MSDLRYPIHTMITHSDPDIDDVEAIRLLLQHGEEKWPGISSAKIEMSSERNAGGKTPDLLEKEGILLVGIGGGRYDEHPFEGASGLKRHSAASLVGQDLGLDECKVHCPTLDYAFAKNYSANTGHFELSVGVKLAFRYLTHTGTRQVDEVMEKSILSDAFLFLDAVEEDTRAELEGTPLQGKVLRTMDDFVSRWLLHKHRVADLSLDRFRDRARQEGSSVSDMIARDLGIYNDAIYRWILDYARSNQKPLDRPEIPSFDLAWLAQLAQKHLCVGDGGKKSLLRITKAVGTMLTAMWAKDYNFVIECRKDFESKSTHCLTLKVGGKNKKIVSVISSNPEMQKFARSEAGGSADLVVKTEKNRSGVQIFFSKRSRLDPKPIIAELRKAEREENGFVDSLSDEHLQEEGNSVVGAECWYYDGHQIMNGSLTTKQPPSKLSREKIEEIVKQSLRLLPK